MISNSFNSTTKYIEDTSLEQVIKLYILQEQKIIMEILPLMKNKLLSKKMFDMTPNDIMIIKLNTKMEKTKINFIELNIEDLIQIFSLSNDYITVKSNYI